MASDSSPTRQARPEVLFVGRDASSPEIAASLLRRAAPDKIAVRTASTELGESGGRLDEMLVAMGLDPAEEHRLTTRVLHTADRVVVLDTGLDVARLSGPRYEEWDLEHDDLGDRVQALSDDLTTVPVTDPHPTALGRLKTLLLIVRR